jgi:CHAT domain-containing protein
MLLAPAADRLKGKALVIVPDGLLCYLPFQLLVDADDKYLIESHRVRYAPSLTTLHLTRQWANDRDRRKEPPGCALFALGDPDYGPTKLDVFDPAAALARSEGSTRGEAFLRLKHSGREVADLEKLFGKDKCWVLLGRDASEAAVKKASGSGELTRYRYLHFACHGVLGRGPGQHPGLVLSLTAASGKDDAWGGVDDGYLGADEVLNLRLNADLVVLSACRSGKGRLHAGEGVEGLARSFLYAGSRGVVCTLWSVDDAATAKLMVEMYARLKDGTPAADALRAAQLELVKAGRPPFYWAAFVLNGQ